MTKTHSQQCWSISGLTRTNAPLFPQVRAVMNKPENAIAIAVARAKRRFPGYEVSVAYPIGWPVYTVRLVLTVLAEHEISTVARYILQLAGLGPAEPAKLGRLLGLSHKFVAGATAELLGAELVVQRPDLQMEITEQGKQALVAGGRSWHPRREYTMIPYDALSRQVPDIGIDRLVYPDVVHKDGLFVVPAVGDKPRLSELHIEAIRNYARVEEGIKPEEITEVSEIRDRDTRLRYRNDLTVVKLDAPQDGQSVFAVYRSHEYLEDETTALQRLADAGANLVPEEYRHSTTEPWRQSRAATISEESLLAAIKDDDQAVTEAEQAIAAAEATRQDTQDARERAQLTQRLAELEAEKAHLSDRLAERENQAERPHRRRNSSHQNGRASPIAAGGDRQVPIRAHSGVSVDRGGRL